MARVPKLRKHSTRDLLFVESNGQRHYFGRPDDPETLAKYGKWLAEHRARDGEAPPVPDILLCEVIARFWTYAKGYYRKNGRRTSEVACYGSALSLVRDTFGMEPANEFSPLQLKAIRQQMIDKGWSRKHVNGQVSRIKAMFKWAASEQLVPATVYQALCTVAGLRQGRSDARETEPVRPVSRSDVDAIKPYVASHVWAMIQLQLLTGARPGEVVNLRAVDLDTSGPVWIARLDSHKTQHHGKERSIYFGPQAIEVVRHVMACRPVDAPLFSPLEAWRERAAVGATRRRRHCQQPTARKTGRRMGVAYTVASYRRAIQRACDKAGVPRWSPNQLRHTFATEIRKRYGIEASQLLLGHSRVSTTEVYAEPNRDRAIEVASQVG